MEWLTGELTSVAFCWRLERRDGVAIGLTAHDRDLVVDGLRYRAAPGMTPSAIERTRSLDADSMDVRGALGSGAITEQDLLLGRWDGARVSVFAIDWTAPGERAALGDGSIGAVELNDGGFSAELRSVAAALDRDVSESTTPGCRAELGDARCRVAMAAREHVVRVVSVEGAVLTLDREEPVADAFAGGRLRWLGGALCGLEAHIARSSGTMITLRETPESDVTGIRVRIREGCDKTIATCAARFGNAENFRGEPYLPGIDLLTRYPGA